MRCATLFLFYVMLSGTKYDGISLTAVSTLGIAAQRHAKCEVVVFSVLWCCLIWLELRLLVALFQQESGVEPNYQFFRYVGWYFVFLTGRAWIWARLCARSRNVSLEQILNSSFIYEICFVLHFASLTYPCWLLNKFSNLFYFVKKLDTIRHYFSPFLFQSFLPKYDGSSRLYFFTKRTKLAWNFFQPHNHDRIV